MNKKILIQIIIVTVFISFGSFAYAQELPLPSLQITSPVEGESYGPEAIEFLFNVKDFTFVSYKNNTTLFPGNPNAGHAHMWITPPPIGTDSDTVYEVESPDFHHLGALERGRYNMTLELVKNDHTVFEPRVFQKVSFRVIEETAPGRYAIIKTVSTEDVGEAPRESTRLFIALGMLLIILVVVFIYRDRLKKHKFVIAVKKRYDKFDITNRLRKNKLANRTKRAYEKLRRKK